MRSIRVVWLIGALCAGCSKSSGTSDGPSTTSPKSGDVAAKAVALDQSSPEALVRWFLTEHTRKEPDHAAMRKVLSKRLTAHFDEQSPEEFKRWVNSHGSRLEGVLEVGEGKEESQPERVMVPVVIQTKGKPQNIKVKVIKEGDRWFWEDL